MNVPDLVRSKALRHPGGERWLRDLDDVIAGLCAEWSLTAWEPLAGGTEACVLRVRTADGSDAVLKLPIPGADVRGQVRTLRDAGGRGYVRMLAHEPVRGAMLLEALGPSLTGAPAQHCIEVLCRTLRQAWRVPVPATEKPFDKAMQLHRIVRDLRHQVSDHRVVAKALRFAQRRAGAADPDRCVVVHGDPHPGNALRTGEPRAGAESGYVFVDPDGFVADPAYDCGVVLRDWSAELLAGDTAILARRYCRLIAEHTGVDETAIWEWGLLERVSSGLYLISLGARAEGRRFLDAAARLV